MSQDVSLDIADVLRSLTKSSLFECLKEVWPLIIQEKPVWNWHLEYLCDEIQTVYEGVFASKEKEYDLIINIPPGTTKSTIVSVVAPMWAWTRMPSLRTIVSTHAYDLGLDLSRKGRDVLRGHMPDLDETSFAQMHGIQLKKDLDSKGHFGITTGGERYVATVGGKNPMGKHAHVLIVDDPIDPEKVFSDAAIGSANRFITNTLPSRMVDKTVTPIILLMQRLHQNDPTGHLLKKYEKSGQPFKHICLPAEVQDSVSPPELAKNYVDGLLDPVRLPRRVLEIIRQTSQYTYASQYLQTPIPLGGGMFKTDLLRERIVDEVPQLVREVRFWDKAASHESGAYTAGGKIGVDTQGRYWITNVRRFQKASNERERAIQATAKLDGRKCHIGMEQEPGSAGIDSIQASIRGLAGFVVTPEKPTGNKAVRADPLASQCNAGNVYLKKGDWNEDLLEEMMYFPNSEYKDQVDACGGAFRMLTSGTNKIARAIG